MLNMQRFLFTVGVILIRLISDIRDHTEIIQAIRRTLTESTQNNIQREKAAAKNIKKQQSERGISPLEQ